MTPKESEEYRRIRKNLINALERSGNYVPELDDLLIDRIAGAEIQSKSIQSIADLDTSIITRMRLVDMEAKLAKIIDNATYQLSISRRDRLANRIQTSLEEEFRETLRKVITNAG